ncbi:MAG TPA: sulfurtransferase TusA family protein, partial [Paludibacter sp.]|nr:sulfurtransferase TusA family protein [Paludibacter sp.]
RYIFYKLGEEKTIELFFEAYNEVKKDPSMVYTPSEMKEKNKTPDFDSLVFKSKDFELWKERYATAQKQDELFAVTIPIEDGNADGETFLKIADFAEAFGNDVIRFTTRQNIQLRNIPAIYLGNAYQLVKYIEQRADIPTIANNIISCTGADTCRLGICLTKGAASALRARLRESNLPLDDVQDFSINISGCPNSCAQQRWSDLGFAGKVMRNGRMFPAYTVYAGANRNGTGELGDALGVVSSKDLPGFSVDVLQSYLGLKKQYRTFSSFVKGEGGTIIKDLVEKYANVPSFDENKDYYYDWGSAEIFSVVNKGQAECSAGLFDMIDVDANTIREALSKLETQSSNELLHTLAFSASRMLLITRGAEPKTTEDVYTLFIEKFIQAGLVSSKFSRIVETARTNPQADLTPHKKEIAELGNTVIGLYESMDDSLQFKNIPEQKTEPQPSGTATTIRTKDLRGVTCPLNFVKTKIELSSLKSGDLLEVWLDDGQPIENVPGSLRNEGHQILATDPVQDYWKVLVRKG